MKMVAPAEIGHFNFDNVEYHRAADGTFDIQHPDHIAAARIHGARDYDPDAPNMGLLRADPVERVPSEFDDTIKRHGEEMGAKDDLLAEKERENAELRARLDRLEALLSGGGAGTAPGADAHPSRAEGTDGGAAPLGDTSVAPGGGGVIPPGSQTTTVPPQGQAGDDLDKNEDKRAELLANKPDVTNYDAMKAWLKDAGVAVPGNVSKARAAEIVEETVKDFEAGLAEAAKERQNANGTATEAE